MKNPGDAGWTNFYFAKNLQGDVVAGYRSDYDYSTSPYYGTLVAKYTYNPYGQVLTMVNGEGTDVSGNANSYARINPFRYRGYYQDNESGFYYLQSRYYDPEICRFINADKYASTGLGFLDCNMFAYCNNNPVINCDPAGEYDRNAAVEYAKEWYNRYNVEYYHYRTDCANFVSQCLFAGNISMTEKWHSYKKRKNFGEFYLIQRRGYLQITEVTGM